MTKTRQTTIDGNEAAASVAYRTNEVISIYPITPASPMGELADAWAAEGRANIWGMVPDVVEMQSEGGAAGTVHGSLQAGAMTTTFTASQGLLLMIPNLYKIAGELTPFCLHVAARTLATHALSIFGDHSDVMSCRQAGLAMLASASVQEAHDMACIAHTATLESRIPFLHFFDGFRTSHEVAKIELLSDDDLHFMIREDLVAAHRNRALSPDHPVLRGTAQNPDAFFQAREAANGFYQACPGIVTRTMARFGARTGRNYRLYDYVGHPQAETVLVVMGSGAETAEETVAAMTAGGARVGVLKVRLFRPFAMEDFLAALPSSTRNLAVLDRTKEPGSLGEPLYQDVVTAVAEGMAGDKPPFLDAPRIFGGRFGLSSKEFTPAMVKAVFDEAAKARPKNHFTVGIRDDVTQTSLDYDTAFRTERSGDRSVSAGGGLRALFFGLGSDGTVGANKNSLKIVGEHTDLIVQGYFVYDSKKSGAVTVSHLRFSPEPIHAAYLIEEADFVACHAFPLIERHEMAEKLRPAGTLLLNAPGNSAAVWDALPREVQQQIVDKRLEVWTIDAYAVAREAGLGPRINTIMQACFFGITGILDKEQALTEIKTAIDKTYGKLGKEVVRRNMDAVDAALDHLQRLEVPGRATNEQGRPPVVPAQAPDFVRNVTAALMAGKGDLLPVSAFPVDGTWPTGTARWEKRNVAQEIPVWDPKVCTQCNLCVLVCPHAAIRAKAYNGNRLADAPDGFQHVDARSSEIKDLVYTLQVAPEDCTGCHICVEACPAKNKAEPRLRAINMQAQAPLREQERACYDFFLELPDVELDRFKKIDVRTSQYAEPLFEYSGACSGCGETPYVKLLTQLFGDRLLIANATGCSSIYGGNLPTTPYSTNAAGRGPTWSNSLFEDNAEFGLGFRMAIDQQRDHARDLVRRLSEKLGAPLVEKLLAEHAPGGPLDPVSEQSRIDAMRDDVETLRARLAAVDTVEARRLERLADYLVPKSVWIVGGDGWAYDIGYGGLDHVLSLERNVNVLVLDTEVYSNTGGQASKATPLGAAAKFAAAGKSTGKKDLGMEAMIYGHVYVARIAFGARPSQTVQALLEAEAWDGPSLVIAYSHCIAHGYDMARGLDQQKLAVGSGVWPLYRWDPRRVAAGEPPLHIDSGPIKNRVRDYMKGEARFRMVEKSDPERFRILQAAAEREAAQRFAIYQQLAEIRVPVIADESTTED